MAAVLIKNFPETLHKRLKSQAKEHHRSMAQEIIVVLENGVAAPRTRRLPPVAKAKTPITDRMIDSAKRLGRS